MAFCPQASNQVALLEPFFANVGKRLVKSPKLYFLDPGLLCFLVGVHPGNLDTSPFVGAIWESFVFAELRKYQQLYHPRAALFFYRDQHNREVDFLWSSAGHLVLLEANWTETIRSADISTMDTAAHVFTMAGSSAYRVKGGMLICRTPEHFSPAAHVRVVNGFRLREAVATL